MKNTNGNQFEKTRAPSYLDLDINRYPGNRHSSGDLKRNNLLSSKRGRDASEGNRGGIQSDKFRKQSNRGKFS